MADEGFWRSLDALVASCDVVVDRARGSPHPRYPDYTYPLDYGYLQGTQSADGEGIDVWIGTQPERGLVGVICTVDNLRRDMEIKLLLGCTPQETEIALASHNRGAQSAILVWRPEYDRSATGYASMSRERKP